jgi:hypothetical protein
LSSKNQIFAWFVCKIEIEPPTASNEVDGQIIELALYVTKFKNLRLAFSSGLVIPLQLG